MISIKIEGAAEIQKVLDSLAPRVRGKVMVAALRSGGNVIRTSAKQRIPIRSEPGAKAFRKGGSKGRLPGFGRASVIVRKVRGGDIVEVGASKRAFYLRFLEFGTRFISARPWLRPAFDETGAAVLERIGASLRTNIDRIATGAARQFNVKR